jgi:hypothetical protein
LSRSSAPKSREIRLFALASFFFRRLFHLLSSLINGMIGMKKYIVLWMAVFLLPTGERMAGQTGDSISRRTVREDCIRKPLTDVLRDFETKYGMALRCDSALMAELRCEGMLT